MSDTNWRPGISPEALVARSRLLSTIRHFFEQRGVTEVQAPVLMPYTVTEPMIDSIEVPGYGWLQVSPEYSMKRLLAAGAGAIYQLGPVFREGERGRWHNPEFTLLEWYRPGFDDVGLMAEVAALVNEVLGYSAYASRRYHTLVPSHLEGDAADLVYAEACAALSGRVFVTHFPKAQASLARLHPDGQTAARFELIVDGVEIANGYFESGDASELKDRFEADNQRRRALGKKEPALDDAFLAAMNAGLPTVSGVALGVDRLFMLKHGITHMDQALTFRI